jgi:hypothetical protein
MNESCKKSFLMPVSIFLICARLLSGCAALDFKARDPVTVGQVIEMSKEGVAPQSIVNKMRDSGTVYRLTAAQLAELHDLGVADQIIDYMQQSYIESERREQSAVDWDDGSTWWPSYW